MGSRGNYSSTAVYWCVYHWCDTQRNERGALHVHVIIVYMCNRPWYTMQYLACQSDSSRRQRKYCMLNVPMCTIFSLHCWCKFFHAWHPTIGPGDRSIVWVLSYCRSPKYDVFMIKLSFLLIVIAFSTWPHDGDKW